MVQAVLLASVQALLVFSLQLRSNQIIDNTAGVTQTLDPVAAVMIATWDSTQWVSYDNGQTLGMKISYANGKCLGGTMVWAIDLDDGTLISTLGNSLGRAKLVEFDTLAANLTCFA